MKIAIIGAGMSGLAAGREFKKAGHDILLLEKSRGYGGRMATRYAENNKRLKLDHGVPFITSTSDEFNEIVRKLSENKILEEWNGKYISKNHVGKQGVNEGTDKKFIAPNGMNSIGKFLGEDLNIRFGERVNKLDIDQKTKNWVLLCESGFKENADALVISAPAPQALQLLSSAGKSIEGQSLIEGLGEVSYHPQFALMLTYSHKNEADWDMMNVDDEIINFISYESKKRDLTKTAIVVHSSPDFATRYIDRDRDTVADLMLKRLISIVGKWSENPEWQQLHLWRYSITRRWLPFSFLEGSGNDAPLALVGSYMKGKTVESAYLSGLRLARKWVNQFSEKE